MQTLFHRLKSECLLMTRYCVKLINPSSPIYPHTLYYFIHCLPLSSVFRPLTHTPSSAFLPSHSRSGSTQSGGGLEADSRSSSRGSLEEVPQSQPRHRDTSSIPQRQKMLLDYNVYMAKYVNPQPPLGSPTATGSPGHSPESSPRATKKVGHAAEGGGSG